MLRPILFIGLVFCTVNVSVSQSQKQARPLSIGEYFEIESDILNENRRINIYLPLGYHPDSSKQYPVIYLLDGSMDEDFIHIAGLVQFCSFSWINIVPESIVVGIANVDRRRDFTHPTTIQEDKENNPTSGGSGNFIEFIEKELIPEINERYKTDAQSTVIGQSLGGLLATEILIKKPDLFNNYMIVSPSLWWDNGSLLKVDLQKDMGKRQIFIAVGKEGELMEKPAKELFLKLSGLKNNQLYLFYEFFEDKNHGDILHQAIYNGFQKMFGS